MATYSIGELIKSLRLQKGITQEQLCRGICSTVTLSRIESGRQVVGKNNFTAIMQRLGLNAENYFSDFVEAEEFDFLMKKKQVFNLIYEKEYEKAKLLLDDISGDSRFQEGLNRQFLLLHSSIIKMRGENLTESEYSAILNDLHTAIKLSIPQYKENEVNNYLLTSQEIEIIVNIGTIYKKTGRISEAVDLMYRLKETIEKNKIDFDEKAKSYILVLFNLSNYLGQSGKHEEVIKICDTAIDACIKSNKFNFFGHILFNKAYASNLLGDDETCKRLAYQAYYLMDAIKNYKDAKTVKEYAKNEFGVII